MKTRIREVRRARKMTLDDVARACEPSTTAQTIGRLETGTRTVSVGWLNRIAAALLADGRRVPLHRDRRRQGGALPIPAQLLASLKLGAVTMPRDNSQPKGDSVALTVTDRTAPPRRRRVSPSRPTCRSSRIRPPLDCAILISRSIRERLATMAKL